MGCATGCIRLFLFLTNLLLCLSGAYLITVGELVSKWYEPYVSFNNSNFAHGIVLIIAVGVILFVVGFLSCYGGLTGDNCTLTPFSVSMTTIVILEVCVAVLTFVYSSKVKELVAHDLENAVQNYDSDIDVSFFNMTQQQITFQCCGKSGPSDYKMRANGIPGSCCKKFDSQSCLTSEAFTKGCNQDVQAELGRALLLVVLSALITAFGHILAIVFACIYTRSKN